MTGNDPKNTGINEFYNYVKTYSPYSGYDFAQSPKIFEDFLNKPGNAEWLYDRITTKLPNEPLFQKKFGATESEFMNTVFRPSARPELFETPNKINPEYQSPYENPKVDQQDSQQEIVDTPFEINDLGDWQDKNIFESILGNVWQFAKTISVAMKPGSLEQLQLSQQIGQAFKERFQPVFETDVYKKQQQSSQQEMETLAKLIKQHPEYKDPNSAFRQTIEKEGGYLRKIIESNGKEGYSYSEKLFIDLANTLGFGSEQIGRETKSEYLSTIKDPKLKSAMYLLEQRAIDNTDGWLEYSARTALNVFTISMQMGKGWKAGGFGGGLAEAKFAPSLRLTRDASKIKNFQDLELLDEVSKVKFLKEAGYADDFKGINKVYGIKEEGILTPKVMEVPDLGVRNNIRLKQLNSYGVQSIKASIPRINYEMNKEVAEMRAHGQDPDLGWYMAAVGYKAFQQYMEGFGEYGGAMMAPYIDQTMIKYIGNNMTRSLTNHFIANPISEFVEERLTDIVTKYIPNIVQGVAPEDMGSIIDRYTNELITFIPLAFSGAGQEAAQNWMISRELKSIKQQEEESKTKFTERQKAQAEESNRMKIEAIQNLAVELNDLLVNKKGLSEEEVKKLDDFSKKGIETLIRDLASPENNDQLSQNIIKVFNERIEKTEAEDIANRKGTSREFSLAQKTTKTKAVQQGLSEINDAIANNDFDVALLKIKDLKDSINKGDIKIKKQSTLNDLTTSLNNLGNYINKQIELNQELTKVKQFRFSDFSDTKTGRVLDVEHTDNMERNLFIANNPAFSDGMRNYARSSYLDEVIATQIANNDYETELKEKKIGAIGGEVKKRTTLIRKGASILEQFIPVDVFNSIEEKLNKGEQLPEMNISEKNKPENTANLITQFKEDVKLYNENIAKIKDYKSKIDDIADPETRKLVALLSLEDKTSNLNKRKQVLLAKVANKGITPEQLREFAPKTTDAIATNYEQNQAREINKTTIEDVPAYDSKKDTSPIRHFSTQFSNEIGVNVLDEQEKPGELATDDGFYAINIIRSDAVDTIVNYFKKLNFTRFNIETNDKGETRLTIYYGSYDNHSIGSKAFRRKFAKFITDKKTETRFQYKRMEEKLAGLTKEEAAKLADQWKSNLGAYYMGRYRFDKATNEIETNKKLDKENIKTLKNKLYQQALQLQAIDENTLANHLFHLAYVKVENLTKDNIRSLKSRMLSALAQSEKATSKLQTKKKTANIPNESSTNKIYKKESVEADVNLESESQLISFLKTYGKPIPPNINSKTLETIIKSMRTAYEKLPKSLREKAKSKISLESDEKAYYASVEILEKMDTEIRQADKVPEKGKEKATTKTTSSKNPAYDNLPEGKIKIDKTEKTDNKANDALESSASGFDNIKVGKVETGKGRIDFDAIKKQAAEEQKKESNELPSAGNVNLGNQLFKATFKTSFRLSEFLSKYEPKNAFFGLLKKIFLEQLDGLSVLNSVEYGLQDQIRGAAYFALNPKSEKEVGINDVKGLKEKLDAAGIDYSKGIIVYNPLAKTEGTAADMLYHEAIHALVNDTIVEKYDAEITAFMNKVKDKIVFNHDYITHAFKNSREFIATIFSDTDGGLKQQLALIETTKGSNALKDIVKIITKAVIDEFNKVKAALGIEVEEQTAWDEIYGIFDRLLQDSITKPPASSIVTQVEETNIVESTYTPVTFETVQKLPEGLKKDIKAKRADTQKIIAYQTRLLEILSNPASSLEHFAKIAQDLVIVNGIFNTPGLIALENILARPNMQGLLVNKQEGDLNVEALLREPIFLVDDNFKIETLNDFINWLHAKMSGTAVRTPAVEVEQTVTEDVKEVGEQSSAIDADVKEVLPIADNLGVSVNADNIDLLVDNLITVRELGIALAKAYNNAEFKNLYNHIKRKGLTVEKWFDLFDKTTGPAGARMNQELLDIWEAKFKNKGITYAEWKEKSLQRLYNNFTNKTYQPHINIHYNYDSASDKITVKKVVSHLGKTFSDADGKKSNTLIGNSILPSYMKLLESVFGKLTIHYVNGFVNEKIRPLKPTNIFKTKFKDRFTDLANQLFTQGFIFDGTYADKSELPVFRYDKDQINLKQIDLIWQQYIKLSGIKPSKITPAQQAGIIMGLMIHEIKHNSNINRILTGNFTIEDSKVLQMIMKDGQYVPGAMFKVFKRVHFMLKKLTGNHERLLKKYGITGDPATSKISGIFTKGRNLYFNHVTVRTSNLQNEFITDPETGETFNLGQLLFNRFGTEITDGLSVAILKDSGFFDFYRDYYGEYKEGSIKQWAGHEYGENPFYLKHSIQGVSESDLIAKWMLKNNIAVLTFESGNKLATTEDLYSLDQIQSGNVAPREIPFSRMSHDMMKGEIQERVKAIKQLITSTFLSKYNPNIHNPVSFMNTFRNILQKNSANKLKKIMDYSQDYKEVYKFFQQKIKAPNGIMEGGFANAFQIFKDMTFNQFKNRFTQILTHPYFAQYLEEYYLNQLESIFNVELPQGSALTIVSDMGIMTRSRINVAKAHLAELDLTYEEVFDEFGRLREGYCYVSENYAKEKKTKVGDKVVTTLVPMDSMLAINSSIVVAVLNDTIMPKGSIVMNSEYVQSIIGRDFDIDVLYTLSFDPGLFTEKSWNTFHDNIKATQKATRESIVNQTKKIIDSDTTIKKRLASELKQDYETFEINSLAIAMNKKTQQAVMEIMFTSNQELLKTINPFDATYYYASEMYFKNIADEINNRTYYTLNSTIGLNIPFLGIMLNPNNNDSELMHLKHQIRTNDLVDSPNRENIFNYVYDPVLDFLQDYVGYEQAKKLKQDKKITAEQVEVIKEIHQALWGNLVMISKDYETANLKRNYGNYTDRIRKQQQIIQLIKAQNWEQLKTVLKNEIQMSRSYYDKVGLNKSYTEKELQFKIGRRGNTDRSKYPSGKELLEGFVFPLVDQYVDGMANGSYNLNDNVFIELVENFPIDDIQTGSINRSTYLHIENNIRDEVFRISGVNRTKSNGEKYTDDEINAGVTDKDGKRSDPIYKKFLMERDIEKAKAGEYENISPNATEKDLTNAIKGISQQKSPTLSFLREVMNAIYNFQSDINLNYDISTSQTVARGYVFGKFLKEVLNNEEIFFTNSTNQTLAEGKNVIKDFVGQDGKKIFDIQALSNGLLQFRYKGKTISQLEVTGEDTPVKDKLEAVTELRELLFGNNNVFVQNTANRKQLNTIFQFLKIDQSNIPENIDRLTRVKVAIEFINENLGAKNAKGQDIHSRDDKNLFWATLMGGFSNKFVLNEAFGTSDNKRPTFNFIAPTAIGEVYRPDYQAVLDRKNIDYEFNKYLLHIVGQSDPAFMESYINAWNRYTDDASIYPPQKEINEMPAYEFDNDYLADLTHKENAERFMTYYNGKYENSKGFSAKNSFTIYGKFFSALMKSPEQAFEFLKDYILDVALLESIRHIEPDGVTRIMKDLSRLSYAQFTQRYGELDTDFDKLNYLKAEIRRYGLKDEGDKLKGDRIRRKLFGIFLSLNLIRDSYLSTPNLLTSKFQQVWYNMEYYAMKHGIKVYLPVDQNQILGQIPVFANTPLGKSRAWEYRWAEVQAHIFEYINPAAVNPFGLAEEASYRMFHINANIREMDFKLQSYLDRVATIGTNLDREIIKQGLADFKGDFHKHFKEAVFDIAEHGLKDITIKQIGERYYYNYRGVDYIIKEKGEKGSAEKDLFESLFPEANTVEARAAREIQVAKFKAALEIRVLLDFEIKIALQNMYSHLSSLETHAIATGNKDLAAKLNKMKYGYAQFYQSMYNRSGSYVPHIWDKVVYAKLYEDANIDKIIKTISADPANKDKTEQQITDMARKQVQEELSVLVENGFGISFNPNAQIRRLPDFVEGYDKDIYKAINTYLSNFKTMMHKDLVASEFYLYQMKARHIKENPYVMNTVKKWYALNGDVRDAAVRLVTKSEINIGNEVEFLVSKLDYRGMETETTIWGRVSGVDANGIYLQNPDSEKDNIYYAYDRIFVRNYKGDKVKDAVHRYKAYGIVEARKQMITEHAYAGREAYALLSKLAYYPLNKLFNGLNYLTTMSNLGFIAQLPAYIINRLGGNILTLDGAWFRNQSYIRRGWKEFTENPSAAKAEIFEQMKIKLGLEMPKFLMDNATFTDLNVDKLGINESWWKVTKSMIDDVVSDLQEITKIKMNDESTYRYVVGILMEQYRKNPTIELRAEIFNKTVEYLTSKKEENLISEYEYDKLKKKYEKIYLAKEKAMPVDPDAYRKAELGKDLGALIKFSKDKFDSSFAGLKIFSSPEKRLRIQAFFVGYYQANEILQGKDEALAVEYGYANVAKKQKFYGISESQFGRNTTIGKVMFKFSHFVWDELVRERKKINNALKTAIIYGAPLSMAKADLYETLDGKKVKIGVNTPRYYFAALAMASFLSELATYFTGLDNPLSPIKNFQYKLYKMFLTMLADISKGRNGFKQFDKFDYEEVSFIRNLVSSMGTGWGLTIPMNVAMWNIQPERSRGRFPVLPRAYGQAKGIVDIYDLIADDGWSKNAFNKMTDTQKILGKTERILTGMNIVAPPISDKKDLYTLVGPYKFKYLYKKPYKLIPGLEEIGEITSNL